MSDLLQQIVGDEDEYYDDDDDDYDYDEEYNDEEEEGGEEEEIIEENDAEEIIEQTKANLTFKNHSERKQELKQNKHTKSKLVASSNDNHHHSEQVLEISEEEMEYYKQLKLYGINGPPKKEDGELNEEINFKLDVLQSSKMFFESVQPTLVTIYSGSKLYDDQYRHLRQNSYRLIREKGYQTDQEMMAAELTHPRLLVDIMPLSKSIDYVQQIMNRTEHLSCLSSDMKYLYIYGGKYRNSLRDDFIQYEILTGKMNIYNNLSLASHIDNYQGTCIVIPPLFGGGMFEHDGKVYIIGKGEKSPSTHIYTIENLREPMKVKNGISAGYPWSYQHVNTIFNSRTFFTIHHSYESNVLEVFLFGGKCAEKAMDEMINIHIPIQNSYVQPITYTVLTKPKVGEWPSARYGHSSCNIANLIFIYGGINTKNQLLNDLYMFDTTTQVWTEVSVESMLPPPLFKHQSFSINNQSFYIFGGQTQHDASNSLFRFDITDKKWYLIEVISDERNAKLSGHQCLATSNKLFIIGGVSDQENTKSMRNFSVLLNVSDPGKPIPICNYLSTKRREGYLCDIIFRVKDMGTDTTSHILAHRCILKARCSYLTEKFSNCVETMNTHNFEGTFLDEEIGVVDISECQTHIFEKYLEFLYSGSLYLENLEVVSQFLEFVKNISTERHYPSLQKICTLDSRKDLSLTKQILADMHKDFATLIDDNTYSDVVVVLDQENMFEKDSVPMEDGEFNEELLSPLTSATISSSGISVHRLIMSRSPFFSRMFVTSGMMETKEKVVHLSDYSKEVMIDLLKYLYTDIIQLSPSNCLGVLVYSLMFDLTDLASCCRRMVISLLDNSTVWVVHEIAILYNEKSLESECEHFIANNFVTLNSSSAFLDLPDMTRIRIKQLYERKYHKNKTK
ncbi:predicted protein [Naegleria gruberi]|uniref:Predicted protein n=1 Tax=Naegleria gruberi TaxID=5762 RepID=D2VR08_NAEGR|nr:uncharacterized protein NAEGRDRAFT_51566 [Naegleria gruberi]EFC40728.1 predicted protein [Naegleria gruberi]|eukprot:XP_002673472.1 predicted protein [Naegleria gruberi strain NEG-M]